MQTSKDSTGLAKQYLIKQLPSFPPSILSENLKSDDNVVLGKGTFGVVTLGKLPYISKENVAVKTISLKTSNLIEIKAELKVLHTLSGHPSFPYCYGFVDSNKIVMQFIGEFINDKPIITTIQSMMGKKSTREDEWLVICFKLCQAIKYMHSLEILHNDIKANNVIIRNETDIKVIDFGKATSSKKPCIYNLSDKSKIKYNLKHRYLAHELRNTQNCNQSNLTDCYSVGYLIKYVGYYEKLNFLHELGRNMKAIDVEARFTLEKASKVLNTEMSKS